MKPRLIGKTCDVITIGNNYVPKPSAIFNTLDVHFNPYWYYLVGMQMQLLLQRSSCAVIRGSRLLCQFTNINAKIDVVLSSVV
jgi:hypothetical protein